MAEFLLTAAGVVLATAVVGLARLLRGPGEADRMMSVQLLGTAAVAALLLLARVTRVVATVDAALVLAVLAAFAAAALNQRLLSDAE